MTASIQILGWGIYRDDASMRHCAITAIDPNGSVQTLCSGRWSARDPWSLFRGVDATVEPKCPRCVELVGEAKKATPSAVAWRPSDSDWPTLADFVGDES